MEQLIERAETLAADEVEAALTAAEAEAAEFTATGTESVEFVTVCRFCYMR